MEQPLAKRRRLSSTTSAGATPVITNPKSPANREQINTESRPSFLSPTKASLARFNPDLLPRPQTEPRKSPRKNPGRRNSIPKVDQTENKVNGDSQSYRGDEPTTIDGGNADVDERNIAPTADTGLSAAPRRRSRTPNAQTSRSKSIQTQSVYGTRGSKLAAAKRAHRPEKSTPDKDKEAAPLGEIQQQNGIIIDQSSLDKLPATPTPHGVPPGAGKAESVGPSLPSTPSQLGLEPPTQRPKGLLFGTPSKMAKLAQRQKETQVASSRNPEETLQGRPATNRPTTLQLGSRLFLADLPKPPPTSDQAELRSKKFTSTELERHVLNLGSAFIKDVLFSSWEEPAAKESAVLQKQQKKLTDISEKLIRLRDEIKDLGNLIDNSPNTNAENSASQQENEESKNHEISRPVTLPLKLAQFFPFLNSDTTSQLQPTSQEEPENLGKHVKISNSKLEDTSSRPDLLLQSHDAWFMSENALLEKIRVKFDSQSLQIFEMTLLPLSEIGANLGMRTAMEAWLNVDVQSKDLFSIGRAVSCGSNIVRKRGDCWRKCEERFGDLVGHETTEKIGNFENEIMFRRKDMTLTIRWIISLKGDGDAQSELSILTDFPPAWWEQHFLSGREVEDVRAAFDLLVRERGVTEAITEIVKLLFPDDY